MKTEDRYLKFVRWSEGDAAYVGFCLDLFPWGGVCHGAGEEETYHTVRELVREGGRGFAGCWPRASGDRHAADVRAERRVATSGVTDVFTKAKRSAVMAAIRGKANKDTELRMMALFRAHGITGWRRGVAMVGKPDFVFRRERVAVFVDGCFWHRHPGCKFAYTPKSRLEFWLPKFERNVARDRVVTRTLRGAGWKVLRVWECDLAAKRWPRVAGRVRRALVAP